MTTAKYLRLSSEDIDLRDGITAIQIKIRSNQRDQTTRQYQRDR